MFTLYFDTWSRVSHHVWDVYAKQHSVASRFRTVVGFNFSLRYIEHCMTLPCCLSFVFDL